MKQNFVGFIFGCAVSVLLFSCKKVTSMESNAITKTLENSHSTIIQQAKTWFDIQRNGETMQTVFLDGIQISVPEKILWDKTRYFAESKVCITPVYVGNINKNLMPHKYLVTEINENGIVYNANYYTDLLTTRFCKKLLTQLLRQRR